MHGNVNILRGLLRDRLGRRGVAAVEFALVVPVMLVMFIGMIEVLTLYRTEGKLNTLAFNVAQMVSVMPTDPPSTIATTMNGANVPSLNDICQGAVMGLAPYPANGLKLEIVSVTLEPSVQNSNSSAVPAVFNEWEADSTVSGSTCSTVAGNAFGAAAAESLATTNPPVTTSATFNVGAGATGEVQVPCDNMIIVKASIPYAGLTGLILKNRPTLTQMAFSRFRYASPREELVCTDCALNPSAQTALCDASSTANY